MKNVAAVMSQTVGRLVGVNNAINDLTFAFSFSWKRTSAGVVLENGKKVLEFVAILRKDNNQWAIPGVRKLQ